MTSEDPPVAPPPSDPLQFEHADFPAAPATAALACSACRQPIADTYYEINGKMLCAGCRDRVAAHFAGGSGLGRFLRALLLGGLAGLAGAALYYLVLAVTGYEVGLIAIVVGYLVGAAVRKGARQRGGLVYQLLAVFLTYTSIVSAYVPLIVAELVNQGKAEKPAGAPAAPAPVKEKEAAKVKEQEQDPEPDKTAEPAPAVAKPDAPQPAPAPGTAPPPAKVAGPKLGAAQLVLVLVIVVGLVYAAPFLAGAQNLLGLAIIFFGLMQAWRLNRKVNLAINGPFQVSGGGAPPQELPAHA